MSEPDRNINDKHDQRLRRPHQRSPAAARSPQMGERSATEISEQQPAYRSVAISPPMHQHRTLHHEPALRRAAPFSAHPRLLGEPRLAGPFISKPSPKQRLGPVKSKSESALPRVWSVDHASLPARPDDFPLLRTHKVIHDTEASVISKRISDCFQSRSVKTKFSKSDKGNNVAKCRNTDFCKFTVALYAEEDGGVLVEVHRLCGDCISFMRDCRAILNAAEGKSETNSVLEKPLYFSLPPVSEMKFLKTASLPVTTEEEENECIGITTELLGSQQSDTNMLGMESLVVQTDPFKSLKSTAVAASRMILCPDDPLNKPFNVHNFVMSLLIYGEEDALADAEDPLCGALEEHASKLRNLAMSALSNSLALFAKEGALLTTLSPHLEWYTSVLIPKLLQELSTAARHPFDACYASRCLTVLAESSTEFVAAMKEAGCYEAVASAEEVGARQFAMLARDARNYHNVMNCCA